MRVFIVLAAILALGCAAPQFDYAPSVGGRIARGGDKYLPPPGTTPEPLVSKKFYIISAPEDSGDNARTKHLVLGRPQKNYRLIFIKASSGDEGNVKYSAEFAPQEEKTVIYVLTRKENDLDASDIATSPLQPASKPEVFFIKYKTPEEADQAQREIQDQYDKLPGENEIEHDTAPVSSVVGSLDGLNPDGSYNYRQVNGGGNGGSRGSSNLSEPQAPSSQYLPSIFRY